MIMTFGVKNYRCGEKPFYDAFSHDTIRLYLCVLKSWRDGQFCLAQAQKQKKLGKTKNKNLLAQKKRCGQKCVKAVWEEEVKLVGVGFVKRVFLAEWKREGVMDEQSGETDEEVNRDWH